MGLWWKRPHLSATDTMTQLMVERERDEETGKYQTKFTDGEFLDAVEELEPATTQEVRERVGCAYRTCHERLSMLKGGGEIDSRKVGNTILWILPENEE